MKVCEMQLNQYTEEIHSTKIPVLENKAQYQQS